VPGGAASSPAGRLRHHASVPKTVVGDPEFDRLAKGAVLGPTDVFDQRTIAWVEMHGALCLRGRGHEAECRHARHALGIDHAEARPLGASLFPSRCGIAREGLKLS
jgi:hypothetical protein